MQKSLTGPEVAIERRKNSMMLVMLFAIIFASMVFAFGNNILAILVLFGLPIVLLRMYEEVNLQYVSQKPEQVHKSR